MCTQLEDSSFWPSKAWRKTAKPVRLATATAAGLALASLTSGSGEVHADAQTAGPYPLQTMVEITSLIGQAPQPPFDPTPITPVESAGAPRFE